MDLKTQSISYSPSFFSPFNLLILVITHVSSETQGFPPKGFGILTKWHFVADL